jgi:hypothetical protein
MQGQRCAESLPPSGIPFLPLPSTMGAPSKVPTTTPLPSPLLLKHGSASTARALDPSPSRADGPLMGRSRCAEMPTSLPGQSLCLMRWCSF